MLRSYALRRVRYNVDADAPLEIINSLEHRQYAPTMNLESAYEVLVASLLCNTQNSEKALTMRVLAVANLLATGMHGSNCTILHFCILC